MKPENIGGSVDDLLRDDGTYEQATATAVKRVLARQISKEMADRRLSSL